MNVKTGRDLLASEASGIAEILSGLALETGTLVKYHTRLERTLTNALFKRGFLIEELLIFGEEELITVGLIVVMKEFSISQITSTVSKVIGKDMMVFEQVEISKDKCYLSFRRSPPLDAVFGIARAVKDGSPASGDTHATSRITDNRFLAALSDGMGSGESAKEISSASLSLIESFYKAGLKSGLILNTVNRLLSINTEDSFAALDVTVINLFDCSADFIKYGSPYGFIIGKGGVKIVEGDSLPLGIIDELKPTVCQTQLSPGDMVVMLTDGISDAFGSSSDMIDFLHTLPAKNPQTFADKILGKAIELSGGKKNDDMTVLAVRIFKRKSTIIN
jgi:stage II sporulation protein E